VGRGNVRVRRDTDVMQATARRLPPWVVNRTNLLVRGDDLKRSLRGKRLVTVCEEARCPNLGECFAHGTATFMILGDACTRRCAFCSVQTARPEPPDPGEPRRVAEAAAEMGLRYVVVTTVARDDLPDEGAAHFVRVIEALRARIPGIGVEVLTADFNGRSELVDQVVDAAPEVFSHNVETIRRLTPLVRGRARYDRSLAVLEMAVRHRAVVAAASRGEAEADGRLEVKPSDGARATLGSDGTADATTLVKTGLMVGMGETRAELSQTLRDVRATGCELLAVGQYLRPTREQIEVDRYLEPAEFDEIAAEARELGFTDVAAGPLVRSSYRADALYHASR
jgi:lipoic acid synthetase